MKLLLFLFIFFILCTKKVGASNSFMKHFYHEKHKLSAIDYQNKCDQNISKNEKFLKNNNYNSSVKKLISLDSALAKSYFISHFAKNKNLQNAGKYCALAYNVYFDEILNNQKSTEFLDYQPSVEQQKWFSTFKQKIKENSNKKLTSLKQEFQKTKSKTYEINLHPSCFKQNSKVITIATKKNYIKIMQENDNSLCRETTYKNFNQYFYDTKKLEFIFLKIKEQQQNNLLDKKADKIYKNLLDYAKKNQEYILENNKNIKIWNYLYNYKNIAKKKEKEVLIRKITSLNELIKKKARKQKLGLKISYKNKLVKYKFYEKNKKILTVFTRNKAINENNSSKFIRFSFLDDKNESVFYFHFTKNTSLKNIENKLEKILKNAKKNKTQHGFIADKKEDYFENISANFGIIYNQKLIKECINLVLNSKKYQLRDCNKLSLINFADYIEYKNYLHSPIIFNSNSF